MKVSPISIARTVGALLSFEVEEPGAANLEAVLGRDSRLAKAQRPHSSEILDARVATAGNLPVG